MKKPSKPQAVETISEPFRDLATLPAPVRALRDRILAACDTGDIEALRIPIDWNEVRPLFERGARRPAGAEPRYKYGVAHLYAAEGVPCVPIALNSGLFWPRRSILRYPGTVIAEVLDPIPPGLSKDKFFKRLQDVLETATARLIAEAKTKDPNLGRDSDA